jgi:hypothetical protein
MILLDFINCRASGICSSYTALCNSGDEQKRQNQFSILAQYLGNHVDCPDHGVVTEVAIGVFEVMEISFFFLFDFDAVLGNSFYDK